MPIVPLPLPPDLQPRALLNQILGHGDVGGEDAAGRTLIQLTVDDWAMDKLMSFDAPCRREWTRILSGRGFELDELRQRPPAPLPSTPVAEREAPPRQAGRHQLIQAKTPGPLHRAGLRFGKGTNGRNRAPTMDEICSLEIMTIVADRRGPSCGPEAISMSVGLTGRACRTNETAVHI